MAARLDRTRPFGQLIPPQGLARWEQDHKRFDAAGREVTPDGSRLVEDADPGRAAPSPAAGVAAAPAADPASEDPPPAMPAPADGARPASEWTAMAWPDLRKIAVGLGFTGRSKTDAIAFLRERGLVSED